MNKQVVWSQFEIKSFDDDARTFEGIATTPNTDREDDIVEPKGAVIRLPIPMKWQHGKGFVGDDQIGEITYALPNAKGIPVKGQFWKFAEPTSLKDDYDRIWALVKKGMRGLSIGFNPIETEAIKGTFGTRFLRWEFLELSPVTIAANQDASITSIKSIDLQQRAASGHTLPKSVRLIHSPGASGKQLAAMRGAVKLIPRKYENDHRTD